jgi:adenosylmethionine-8-amino-7-oxononanoate aminotransferase
MRSRGLDVARAEDVWIWDRSGRRYLDAAAGFAGVNAGHSRPEVAAAVADALVHGDVAAVDALAERLTALAPVTDAAVAFSVAGPDDAFDARVAGFGRGGTWFGCDRAAAIVFGDALTNGTLPLRGVIAAEHTLPAIRADVHPACAAAGLATLDVLEPLLGRGRELEDDLLDALRQLEPHPLVEGVRGGSGLLGIVSLAAGTDPVKVAELSRLGGVLVQTRPDGIAVAPPLTATADQFELILEALSTGLDAMARVVV